ncbi:MAG: SPASM domain-containing protein, partial [Clostridiales bacterium]|nr:SPASM domain-containing protein [Clostridiales bacterium]
RTEERMSVETARKAVDLAVKNGGKRLGLIFFGGEPLLCRGLIEETVAYAREKAKEDGREKFFHKLTTNGLLLDEAFLRYARENDVFIALSLDGTEKAHDAHRKLAGGGPTHGRVAEAAERLLLSFPYAPALMTVNPDTVQYYCQSVEYLYALGFRYIVCSLNYAADWDKTALGELKRQYNEMASFYYEHSVAEDKFYLSPFEVKISSHVHNKTYCHERCELGQHQLSVSPDGGIYPCVQFVGDGRYQIGGVYNGIDEEARAALYVRNEREKPGCDVCSIQKRCNHYCACLNKQATGSIDAVSEVLCAHERIILPIADRVAARLYKKRSPMFIQKHYNDFYPLISLAEDKTAKSRPPG